MNYKYTKNKPSKCDIRVSIGNQFGDSATWHQRIGQYKQWRGDSFISLRPMTE